MDETRRFWDRVDRRGFFDCWPWTGRTEQGYGRIVWQGHDTPTHRLAWMLTNGPIPRGLVIRHDCDNPPCCNPAHLLIGTHADNVHDKVARGRQARGETNGRARLTADDVRAIRRRAETETLADLGRAYGVNRRAIQFIVDRVNWKHLA